MRYVLDERYRLRGWLDSPAGVFDTAKKEAVFLRKNEYLMIMRCDGAQDIHDDFFSDEKEKLVFNELLKRGFIRPAGFAEFLKPEQEYKTYAAPYKKEAHWSITGACNLKCRHCFMSAPKAKHGSPSHEQIIAIADQLQECGVFQTGLTGGEPLIREDFLSIIDALNEREIGINVIYTNGWLVDEQFLDELDQRHVHPAFQLSFDGIGWHDFLRGVPGAEEKTIKTLNIKSIYETEIAVYLWNFLKTNNCKGLLNREQSDRAENRPVLLIYLTFL